MKRYRTISLAIILLSGLQITAQEVHSFSAQQAVEYAQKNNVQVKNALLGVQIQAETNREFTSAAYPQFSGSLSVTNNVRLPVSLIPGDFFGQPGTLVPLKFGVNYSGTAGFELNQLLFDGQVFVGLQARKTAMEWQQKNAEVTEEMIKANIYKIYYQLVVSKEQIAIIDANTERLEKLSHDSKELFKNGFAEKLDIDKLDVQLSNVRTEKAKALNGISNGYLGLKLLMGMPPKDSLVLTDTLSYSQIKEDIGAFVKYNYNDRKEFQYAELGRKLGEFNIRRYKLSQIPTVSLNAYYNKNAQRNKFNFFKGGEEWFSNSAVTLRVNVPIFNGFSTKAKIKRTELELEQTKNQIENLKLTIDNEVMLARNNFLTAILTLEEQKKNIALAESVYNQTKKKYEAGVGSNTEITIAQSDLRIAQTNYIASLYDAIIAKVDYQKALGKL